MKTDADRGLLADVEPELLVDSMFDVASIDKSKRGNGLWERILRMPMMGGVFFRSGLSEHQKSILAEFTFTAITMSYHSALGFFLVIACVCYLAVGAGRPGSAIAIVCLAALVAFTRLSFKTRFSLADLTKSETRRRAHYEVIATSVAGALLWASLIASAMPYMDVATRNVCLLLLMGSVIVGSGFMTLAPPAYPIHLAVITSTFVVVNLLHPFEYSTLLSACLVILSIQMYRVSHAAHESTFRLALRLSQAIDSERVESDKARSLLTDSHLKVDATLRASTEARNLFLAKISHEFRAPLQTIVGSIDLLTARLEGSHDVIVLDILQSLNTASENLIAHSTDLGEFLKNTSTQYRLKEEPVELVGFLKDCMALHDPVAKRKGLSMWFTCVQSTIQYTTDASRLRQIITNILANAVKYTEVGSILVECKAESGGGVSISVRDTGVGISPEGLKNIFEPWYRESKDRHGLGLGLAIVQSTTFALGGKISIQSALGVGTQITLTLPPKKKK